ncbi:MAG: hypothetical protein GF330_02645 [Candidatus Eisenbacteria bacterium]|nr:hypothetical protein [Candidatus Eisenbacteria bacterium]
MVPCAVLLVLLVGAGAARAQQADIIDIEYPLPIPYFIGNENLDALGLEYGTEIFDTAMLLPMYLYRPIDDLTPRPGAQALGMGGAYTAHAEGPLALGWNPAGLGRLREPAFALDGLTRSSTSTSEGLPDTVMIEGQPNFRITRYEVRLAGANQFGFAGGAMPLVWIGDRPLVGGVAYRRHTDVTYGEETVLEMSVFETTGYPFVLGQDNSEQGSIESLTMGLGYEALSLGDLWLSLGATANFLTGRMTSNIESRISVRGYEEGMLDYRMRYKGFSVELGAQAALEGLVQVGGWVGLPHSIYVHDGRFTNTPIIPPNASFVYRTRGEFADYDLEVPLFASGGVRVGPIRGIELAADVNYRPWSEAEIKHRLSEYQVFDAPYPGADVTSFHVGGRFEFPLFRRQLHDLGLRLMTQGGYRTLPLSMYDLDVFHGEAPYFFGDPVEGDAYSFGFSLETRTALTFHFGLETQGYKFRKWFLDDTREMENRELSFSDPWARAPIVDRSVTVLRFGTEMNF